MVLTINNMTMVQVGKACKAESHWLKLAKLLSALATGILAAIVCSYFSSSYKNVTALQDKCADIFTN